MTPAYRERGEKLTLASQRIFSYLIDHPLEFRKEIRHSLRMPNGTFQYHLEILEDCGLLRPVHYDGKTYYRILIRGAPRVALTLREIGWDEREPGGSLAEVGAKVDEILATADRAVLAHAARESHERASKLSAHYSALRALLLV
jgi:hypothetical protein